MTEGDYQALCAACDRLLLAPEAGPDRIGIPWLHVMRPHPIFLPSYAGIFSAHPDAPPGPRLGRSIASAVRHLGKAALSGSAFWAGEPPQSSDVLIISHLVNETFAGREDDFYYGPVPAELAAKGISATLALINYTKLEEGELAASWQRAAVPRVILSPVLNFPAELSLYRRVVAESSSLRTVARQADVELDRRVASRAAQEALGGGTVGALRLAEQIRALVSHLQPRAIVVTYEGHAWERLAFAAAREARPGIACIGYQHAALFYMQHAAQRGLGAGYNPDVVLTSGALASEQLDGTIGRAGVRIAVMGSNRSSRHDADRQMRPLAGERPTCIVLPEGVASECNLLFGFSLRCAEAMPEVEFIWRLHPSMSYENLASQNPDFLHLPPNITLSARPLNEDVARSHWALYRGSTAIVQAVIAGARPVYMCVRDEISVDTLHEIRSYRAEVAGVADFMTLVAETGRNPAHEDCASDKILEFCERMFTPLDSSVLAACLENHQKDRRKAS